MNIGEFFVALGFKFDDKGIKRASEGFQNFRKNVLLTTAAFGGAIYAVERFVRHSLDQAQQFQNLSNQTGIAVEQLQRFESIGRRVGLASGTASQGIAKLSADLAAFRLGQGNIAPYQMAGIDVMGKNVFEVLGQLREKIKGMDNAMATHFITNMGLTPEFINILKLTDQEFTSLSKNAFFSNQKGMLNLRATIEELRLKFDNLRATITAKLAPVLIKLINEFFVWFNKNRSKIISTIETIIGSFATFAKGIARGVNFLTDFINKITKSENGLKIFAAAIAGVLLSFRPFLFGLTALLLLLDDIAVWQMGGDSLFGGFYEALAKLGKALAPFFTKVKESFAELVDFFKPAFAKIKEAFAVFEKQTGINLKDLLGGAALLAFLGQVLGVFKTIRLTMVGMAVVAGALGGPMGIVKALLGAAGVAGALIGIDKLTGLTTEEEANTQSQALMKTIPEDQRKNFASMFDMSNQDKNYKDMTPRIKDKTATWQDVTNAVKQEYNNNVNINQAFYGETDAKTVGGAAKTGTEKALNNKYSGYQQTTPNQY